MILDRVPAGRDLPNDFNVIVEIPMNGDPIKYELDKETGAMYVDRFMSTAMFYPCNYGYIPRTLAADGDPLDVLVITPVPLITGVVVRCRAVGMLKMTDEDFDLVINVHLRGTFTCVREAYAYFKANDIPGRIIAIGSLSPGCAPAASCAGCG